MFNEVQLCSINTGLGTISPDNPSLLSLHQISHPLFPSAVDSSLQQILLEGDEEKKKGWSIEIKRLTATFDQLLWKLDALFSQWQNASNKDK